MASLELSMIVKNGGATLARCLASARPVVDEIVIADTGSTDNTVEIARQFDARVVNIAWEDDFAKARNAALEHGRCDWVLSLDADEMLDAQDTAGIAPLLESSDVFGYEVRIWNYVRTLTNRMMQRPALPNPQRLAAAQAFPAYLEHTNIRLFRRNPAIRFEGQVHETVSDCMRRQKMNLSGADFIIHHLGIAEDGVEDRKRKMEYYQELGRRKLKDTPNDVRAWFELGLGELDNLRNPAAALPYFQRAIELQPEWSLFWTYAGLCQVRLGKTQEGLETLRRARQLGASDAVHSEAVGDAYYQLENFAEAQKSYMAAKSAGSRSNLVESKLGVCELRLGAAEIGLRRIQDAISREPDYGELYDILMAAALFAGNGPLAAETAEKRLSIGSPSADSYLITAAIWAQLGGWPRALQAAQSGSARFPSDARLQSAILEIQQKMG